MVVHPPQTIGLRRRHFSLALRPAVAVAGLIVASFAVRVAAILGRDVQRYLPDEYLYGQLARSIADGHGAHVLGESVALPALLQPILTAPAWLLGDPEIAFRLTQCANAAAMSLGAVVAYLLARELGIRAWTAVGVVGVTLASPGLLYAGYVTADAFGYALALFAILLAVRAIARPSLRLQAGFIAAAGLATFARAQYVALFVAAALAAVVVERVRIRTLITRHALILGVPVLVTCAITITGHLGRYASVTSFGFASGAIGWLPPSAFMLVLATGIVVVPGAVAWSLHELVHPQNRRSLTFASLTTGVIGILLVAAALLSDETASDRFFERYLIIGAPLAAIAFGCWISRPRAWRYVALGTSLALVISVARVPLSGFTAGQGRADSPFLLAVGQLEATVGIGDASLLVALAASAASFLAIAAAVDRVSNRVMFGAAIAVLALMSFGAHAADRSLSREVLETKLGPAANWVDRAGVDDVLLVQTARGDRTAAMLVTLRNRSISGAALLGLDATSFDGVAHRLTISDSGILELVGLPVRRPLAIVQTATRVVMHDADVLGRGGDLDLVQPRRDARAATVVRGLYRDGWLAGSGLITVFGTGSPAMCRRATVRLTLPAGAPPERLRLSDGASVRQVVVHAHHPMIVRFVTSTTARRVRFEAAAPRVVADPTLRSVSVRADLSTITRACIPG